MIVALLCVIGQSLPLVHLLLVRHARCELHGETIHVGEADSSHTPSTAQNNPATSSVRSSEERADDHGHDHCQVVADRRDGTCDRVTIAGFVPPITDDIDLLRPAPAAACRRLYHLAPKLSPPITA